MTPEEMYRAEKAKRGLSTALPPKLGPVDGRRGAHEPTCPRCGSHVVMQSYKGRPSKQAMERQLSSVACGDCGHRWRSRSKQPFTETRQVEVRG